MQTQDDITQIVKTINLHLCEVAPKATAKKGEHGQTIYIDIVGVYVAHIVPYYKGWGHRREMRAWRLTGDKVPSRTGDQRNRYIERKNLIELLNICAQYLRLDTPHERRVEATKMAFAKVNKYAPLPHIRIELFLSVMSGDPDARDAAHQAEQAGWRYVENQAAIAAASEMWSDFDNRMQQKEAA